MATLTATQANFDAQLAKLAPGDTLQVSGPFSGRPGGRKFTSPTTIDLRQAVVSDIYSGGWGGCNFLGGKGYVGPQFFTCLRIEASSDCSFSGFDIDGSTGPNSGFDTGMWLNGGSNLLAELNKITGGQGGIRTDAVTGLILRKLDISRVYEDAIKINDGWNLLIELCKLWNFAPMRPGDHPDGVQIGSSKGRPVSTNIVVQDNTIIGCIGQGIFATPYTDDALGFNDVNIRRNNVEAGMVNGIVIAKCPTWAIEDNSVKTTAGSQWQSIINNSGPGRKRNIVAAYTELDGRVKPEIRDPDYVPPTSPTPSPSPSPSPTPLPVPTPTPLPTPTPTPKPPADKKVTLGKGQRLIVSGAANVIITGQ